MSNKNHNVAGGRPGGASRISLQRKQYRILDESSRNRRNRQQIEQLERDNFHEEPHSNLVMHKKAPKFEDLSGINTLNGSTGKSASNVSIRRTTARARVYTLNALIEENSRTTAPNYLTILTRSGSKSSSVSSSSSSSHTDSETVLPKQQKSSSSKLPKIRLPSVKRNFCSVCGFKSTYTCIVCGLRYCSSHCQQIHVETRCLKWTG